MEDQQRSGGSRQRYRGLWRRRATRRAKGWIGAAAGLAGIVALAFFLKDRYLPPAFTLSDWTREANTVCDDRYSNLISAINKSNESMDAVNTTASKIGKPSGPSFATLQALLRAAADDLDELSGQERQIKQDFERIKLPKEHRGEVEKLLGYVDRVAQKDANFAQDTRDAAIPTGNGETYSQYIKERNGLVGGLRNELQKLGVTKCLQ
jgi:hypothetical protein